jgi:PleD family two-component response regulator
MSTSTAVSSISTGIRPEEAHMESHLDQMPGPIKKQASKRSRSSVRVLVVDDFLPITNALENTLATNFYDARVASSASEALDIAEDFRPHALITDVILPDMDGFRLASEFGKRYPDCRVLLMSVSGFGVPNNRSGLRVVLKASIVEEAFRLLEDCREGCEQSKKPSM